MDESWLRKRARNPSSSWNFSHPMRAPYRLHATCMWSVFTPGSLSTGAIPDRACRLTQ